MATRKNLKGVAGGLAASFNSRNNGVEGYWAIGKLCSFANSSGTDTVAIDLLSGETLPPTDEFALPIHSYRLKLTGQLKALGIPATWVTRAVLTLSFNQEYDRKYHDGTYPVGHPYLCRCDINDDRGKTYTAIIGAHCRPHDPAREYRSGC
ncbi:hypothetical protein [Undibacterium sp.]|uniref:hypothetical protein n=1 Tax=Undibacterium sp. TaxID=1914977 RepID=UPI002BF50D2C|nr:hypothetical protein [Undibacterium sp.]HTD05120.1 hypothetical protein [Undibacterium sp.]